MAKSTIGQIDPDLPSIKRIAVEAMASEYQSKEDTLMKIANYITDFYRIEMPEYYEENRVRIDKAWREMGCWECHTGIQP